MPAPKGHVKYNNATGIPKYTPEELLEGFENYRKWCEANPRWVKEVIKGGMFAGTTVNVEKKRPYTLQGFCIFMGIVKNTFDNYGKNETYLTVVDYITQVIQNEQIEGSTVDQYNPNIIARLVGLQDKKSVEMSGSIEIDFTN